MTRSLLVLVATLLLSGCSPLRALSELSADDGYRRVADLAYGPEPRQKLDLYLPETVRESTPLVVFFYGGGWRNGDKADYGFVAGALAGEGLAVAVPDYRVWPGVQYPAFVEDGAAALAWLGAAASQYGVDGERVFLMGHSAGAQIAALLALDPGFRERAGARSVAVSGLIGLSGPYDFLPLDEGSYLQEVFPAARRQDSQAINHVDPGDPPTLLIHGADDGVVEPGNSERLAAALAAAGVDVTLRIYADRGHASIAAAFAPYLDFVAETRPETLAFIRRVAGEEAEF